MRLEALAMAIAREHNAFEVSSEAFETLNPGLLRAHVVRPTPVTPNQVRIFDSYTAGHQALVDNLKRKCQGATLANGDRGKLGPASSLRELCGSFRYVKARTVVDFLQDALNDRAITEATPLEFFVEGPNGRH